jgi:hypothetical protein
MGLHQNRMGWFTRPRVFFKAATLSHTYTASKRHGQLKRFMCQAVLRATNPSASIAPCILGRLVRWVLGTLTVIRGSQGIWRILDAIHTVDTLPYLIQRE